MIMNMEQTTEQSIDVLPEKKRRSRGEDYVNNKEFSAAVAEYSRECKQASQSGQSAPPLTDYIAVCLYKIANGLSRAPNFASYSYREDMVMDAVENCIKAVSNYDISSPTRTGNPNAFSYFTQISYFAFLRRLAKEKKQADIKRSLIEQGSIGNFAEFDDSDIQVGETLIEKVRQRNDAFYDELKAGYSDDTEENISEGKKKQPIKRALKKPRSGPLSFFIEDVTDES